MTFTRDGKRANVTKTTALVVEKAEEFGCEIITSVGIDCPHSEVQAIGRHIDQLVILQVCAFATEPAVRTAVSGSAATLAALDDDLERAGCAPPDPLTPAPEPPAPPAPESLAVPPEVVSPVAPAELHFPADSGLVAGAEPEHSSPSKIEPETTAPAPVLPIPPPGSVPSEVEAVLVAVVTAAAALSLHQFDAAARLCDDVRSRGASAVVSDAQAVLDGVMALVARRARERYPASHSTEIHRDRTIRPARERRPLD